MGDSAGARINPVDEGPMGVGKATPVRKSELVAGKRIHVDEIESLSDLEALRDEWTALLDQSPGATPFSSPEWLCPWWRHFGGVALRCLAIRIDGVLTGLAPLYVREGRRGLEIRLLGTGNSDHLDVLAREPHEQLVAREVLNWLEDWAERGGACELNRLSGRSALLEAGSVSGSRWKIQREEPCPVVRVPRDATVAQAISSPSLARRIAYARRRASRSGSLSFEVATEETLDGRLDELFSLHGERWALRGENGVLGQERVREFLRDAARQLLRSDHLHLLAIELDDIAIGSLFALRDRTRMYYYISGFAPAHSRLSPGLLLVAAAMQGAIERRLREFDFLSGGESYKYEWGAIDEPAWRLST